MKPGRLAYHRAESVEEAVGLLAANPYDAKVLAGGQSLMPMLNMRLAQVELLVDIAHVGELKHIDVTADGVRIGAATTQSEALESPDVRRVAPLVPEALGWASHPAIRNRGTVVGSIVHADPAAELPAVLTALDGSIVVRGPQGTREIPAAELFVTYLTTAVEPEEVAVEVVLPAPPRHLRAHHAFLEVARRHSDFALVAVAVRVLTRESGEIDSASIALGGVAETPVRASVAEQVLAGRDARDARAYLDAARAAAEGIDPNTDVGATADYRRKATEVLVRRALAKALNGDTGDGGSGH